jgi:hypothetical protein
MTSKMTFPCFLRAVCGQSTDRHGHETQSCKLGAKEEKKKEKKKRKKKKKKKKSSVEQAVCTQLEGRMGGQNLERTTARSYAV